MEKFKTLEQISKERNLPKTTLHRWAGQGMKSVKAKEILVLDEWVDEYIDVISKERADVPEKPKTIIRYEPLRKVVGNRVY